MIKRLFFYFLAGFDNYSRGASALKISAFWGIWIAMIITIEYSTSRNLLNILVAWLLFILLCLGLIKSAQLVELVQSYKNGNSGKTIVEEKKPLDEHLQINKNTDNNNIVT